MIYTIHRTDHVTFVNGFLIIICSIKNVLFALVLCLLFLCCFNGYWVNKLFTNDKRGINVKANDFRHESFFDIVCEKWSVLDDLQLFLIFFLHSIILSYTEIQICS